MRWTEVFAPFRGSSPTDSPMDDGILPATSRRSGVRTQNRPREQAGQVRKRQIRRSGGIRLQSAAVGALTFSSYLRQNRGPEKAAGEARTVRPEPEIKQPAPAATAPAVTSPNSADIFAGSNQKTSSSSAHVLHPQGATATLSARSH